MIVLAEFEPLDTVAGARVTLRATTADHPSVTGLNSVRWWPAVAEAPSLNMRLFKGDFDGQLEAGQASISVRADGLAKLDANARRYRWAGAPVRFYAGVIGQAWPWTQVFEGLFERFEGTGNNLRLTARVDTEPFQKNVLASTYAGTGGIEGGADLKNKPKPLLMGRCVNVEPILINAVDSIYQFHGYGPIQAVNALYERGSSFGASVGDFASYAALQAATIPAGRWGTCLAQGLIRLGAPAYGVITGDVDGDNTGGWRRKTGEIITRIGAIAGVAGGAIDAASMTALDTALAGLPNQGRIGLFLTDQENVLDLAARLAAPCNAQVGVSFLGKLFAMRAVIGAPTLTLDAQGRQLPAVLDSVESDVSPPYTLMEFGWGRAWRVHSFSEISFYAELVDRGAYSAAETYREGNIVQDQGSSWLYINPTATAGNAPPTLPTTSDAYWRVMAVAGGDGVDGTNAATVFLYQRSASLPSAPSTTATYTFSTGLLAGHNNGWSQSVPAHDGNPLYVTTAAAISSGATDTIAAAEWSTVRILADNGAPGSNGSNNATVYLYRRSATTPALPSTTATYTFATGVLTGHNNGWTQAVPATDGNPLWVTAAAASSTGATDTIASAEWAAPVIMAQDGTNGSNGGNGINSATIFLYQRAASTPSVPTDALTYTFSSALLSGGGLAGWSQTVPAHNGNPLYVTTATALSTGSTDTIASAEWASVRILAENGAPGSPGAAAFTLSPPGQSFTIACNSAGVPKVGEFNKTITFALTQGTTDLSNDAATTYEAAPAGATVSWGGANGKVLTISAMSGDTATVAITVKRSGIAVQTCTVTLTKAKDGSPGTQNSVGGASFAANNNTASYLSTNIAGPLTLTCGASGVITAYLNHDYGASGPNDRFCFMAGSVFWRPVGGTTWTQLSEEVDPVGAHTFLTGPGELAEDSNLGFVRNAGGLTPGTAYEFVYRNRRTSGAASMVTRSTSSFQIITS